MACDLIFSSARGTFSRIDHILAQKWSLDKFKKIEIISSISFWPHYETKYQLQKKDCKKHKHLEVKNTFLSSQQVTDKIRGEIFKNLETNDNKSMMTQNLLDVAKQL